MFTDCPSCTRQFRISAAHLSMARGQVKCGYCGTQFNALERLHDAPLPGRSNNTETAAPDHADITASPPLQESAGGEQVGTNLADTVPGLDRVEAGDESSGAEADLEAEDLDEDAGHGQHTVAAAETDGMEAEPEFDIPEQHPHSETTAAGDDHAGSPVALTPQGSGATPLQPAESADLHKHGQPQWLPESQRAAVAELSLQELEESGRGRGRWWWAAGAVLMFLAGTSQLLWFQRDMVLSRYPDLIPWAERLCARLDCKVIRFRDVSAIKLMNRDVREHPRYEHALLVNATMRNQSSMRQPYPDIQLSLYDTEGSLIAHRIFKPHDYLDDSIDIARGMAPDIPVHFVLEVTGPTDGAVSFEFKFL